MTIKIYLKICGRPSKFADQNLRWPGSKVRTKQKLAQTRAGQTRGLGSRSRRHRPPRERWEEARGGRRPRPTMEDPSPDDAGQKTVRRSRRAGRDEGGSRTLRRSAGGCTKRLGAAGTRGTMWKTASASPPSAIGRTTPASRRPHPQRTLHKDRKGGGLFLFTHLTVERCPFLFIYLD